MHFSHPYLIGKNLVTWSQPIFKGDWERGLPVCGRLEEVAGGVSIGTSLSLLRHEVEHALFVQVMPGSQALVPVASSLGQSGLLSLHQLQAVLVSREDAGPWGRANLDQI